MPEPNQRADHSWAIFAGQLENNFPDPGQPNNPEGKPQSAEYREKAHALHKEFYPELYGEEPDEPDLPTGPLLQPTDFEYLGAFQLPAGDDFTYAKGAASYVAERGTLLVVCHDHTTKVAEIEIPEIRNEANASDLARATIRTNPVTFPWTGIRDVELYNGRLYGHSAAHYEYTRAPRHFSAPFPLSGSDVKGQWFVGTDPPVPHINTNEYLFEIDPAWAAVHTPGMPLACGRHREGQAASGPAIIAFEPKVDAPSGTVLAAKPLLLYGMVGGPPDTFIQEHCKADDWRGGAWIGGTSRAVLIFGEKGRGACWYGWQDPDGTRVLPPGGNCSQFTDGAFPCKIAAEGDPKYQGSNRGYCSDTYENWFMLFDPADLAKVARGELPAHEPQPYAHWNVTPFLLKARQPGYVPRNLIQVGGVALDQGGRRIFFSERYGAGGKVVIHVARIAG